MAKKIFSAVFSFVMMLSLPGHLSAQKKSSPAQKRAPVSADCKAALKLSSAKKATYGPTVAPKGFGNVMDVIACDRQDVFTFEKEHNTAWYYFTVPEDGDVIFEIIPVNPKNDYDFMLFKYTDSCFCDNVKLGYVLPVRTNLSRSGKEGVPMTGLAADAFREHVPLGEGEPLSRSLPVRQGEKYFLALDNVRPKGDGHILKLYYLKEISISGTVSDEGKKPLAAFIRVEDKNGKIISSAQCDANGKYALSAKIKDDEYYTLIYTADSAFMECRELFITEFAKTNFEERDIKTTLKKLERGKKYTLDAISFAKNSVKLLPSSYSSLNALCNLMKQDTSLTIQIEGHVNDPASPSNTGADRKMGLDKANAIYNYLLLKGIRKERMTAVSYGSLFMLYPKPSTPEEVEANNRVEVFFPSAR